MIRFNIKGNMCSIGDPMKPNVAYSGLALVMGSFKQFKAKKSAIYFSGKTLTISFLKL